MGFMDFFKNIFSSPNSAASAPELPPTSTPVVTPPVVTAPAAVEPVIVVPVTSPIIIAPTENKPRITMVDFLQGRCTLASMPTVHQQNAKVTLEKINQFYGFFYEKTGRKLKLNDGYRRLQDQPKNASTRSNHLIGAAIDIDDDDTHYLWNFVFQNLDFVHKLDLYMEDPRWTHGSVGTWMHFQIFAPGSGRRIYIPSKAPASLPSMWDGKYDSKYDLVV